MSFSKGEKKVLGSANVSSIIPHATSVTLSEVFQDASEEITIQGIKQREVLFYDERLIAFVVLHLPQCSEDELKSFLSRLDLKVEAWATKAADGSNDQQSSTTTSPRELINSVTVNHSEDPIVLVSQSDQDEGIYLDLIWETDITLHRPRVRFQDACTILIPKATISALEEPQREEIYLEPFKPQSVNLFESMRGLRGFEDEVPYLPIDRLDAISPVPPKDENTYHIQSISSIPIPTHLAFITRLKYSKFKLDQGMTPLIASLDIEMIPFVKLVGTVETAMVSLHKGKVIPLTDSMLPIECQSRDCVTFLYRLNPVKRPVNDSQMFPVAAVDVLSISIVVKLKLLDECQPVIRVDWVTNADFSQSSNAMSNSAGQSMQRQNRPPNLSIESGNHIPSQSISSSLQPLAHAGTTNTLLISFQASETPIHVGVPFTWQVLIVNRTPKAAKLAIIPLPRIPKTTTQAQRYAKRHATKSSVTSLPQHDRNGDGAMTQNIAQANMDENVIYALQHSAVAPPETDIMSLTPEIRIGPLGPGQCHQCEIKLVAFKPGAFTMDAIRIVDLVKEIEEGYGSPGVITDVRELPDVIVKE